MERRWGQVTLQGSPELLGVPGVMLGLGPGGKGRNPLPTSTASGVAPPSTGVSGASSSSSVDRLYSTICQTTGGANPSQTERAGPAPVCNEGPSLLPGSRAWGPSNAPPSRMQP